MTIQEFQKTVKIFKSHKLANNRISITYAYILGDSISSQNTIGIEKTGGALKSLYGYKCG